MTDEATKARSSGVLTGIALTTGAYAVFALQDATVKWLAASYAVPQILFARSLVVTAIALALGGSRSLGELVASRRKSAILARAAVILCAWLLYYSASRHLGLAEMTTLYFVAPVMAVALAALILKEKVALARWFVVALGFAGVLVAAGPGGAMPLGPSLAVLAAAGCWASGTVLVRWIGRSDSTLVQMIASNTLFSLACLPMLPWLWRMPDAEDLALMLGLGLAGAIGQYLLFEGFRFAPASVVAPIEYTGLVWAFVYGYAIWHDVPPLQVFAGAALIVASSLTLLLVERRRGRREARSLESWEDARE